ncbi:MAG: carbohydrate kinase family protein [Patescibacteria group bacterium]
MFSKVPKILTIGGLSLDIMLETDEFEMIENKKDIMREKLMGFEYGAKVIMQNTRMTHGGGAANTAVNFAQLGFSVSIMACIGVDAIGKDAVQYLKGKKVKTKWMQRTKDASTATSVIVSGKDTRDHVAFVSRGATADLVIHKGELKAIKPEWIYITSLAGHRSEINLDAIFDYAKDTNVNIAWNPGSKQIASGCEALAKHIERTAVLIVNKDEAIEMVCSLGTEINEVPELLRKLHNYGPHLVCITCGEDGAYAYNGNEIIHHKALDVERVNTTGAGDAFGSTFTASYAKKRNMKQALSSALVSSSEVIQRVGAQEGFPSWEKIATIIKQRQLPM